MGVVYWLETASGGSVAGGDRDLKALFKASDQLDGLCELAGLRPLSYFCFSDEAAANRELARLFPEEAWAQEIPDDGNNGDEWHSAADGLATMVGLCEFMMSNDSALPEAAGLSVGDQRVLDELLFVADRLTDLPNSTRFRLQAVQ